MKPFYKYSGGKTREMKNISAVFPAETKRIIEPFCGSCAVSFNFELPAIVSDIDDDVINLLSVVQDDEMFKELQKKISETNITETKTEENNKHLEKVYYFLRDDCWRTEDRVLKAYRFLVLRQLCFSGMSRVNNKTGKSNVPYGWYGLFSTRLSQEHSDLLKTWDIKLQSWEKTIAEARTGDWVFLDPPYFERNSSYEVGSDAGTSEVMHRALAKECAILQEKQIPFLLVHSDCELYRDLFKDFIIQDKAMFYSQNFKGRAVKDARVGHLYISNQE